MQPLGGKVHAAGGVRRLASSNEYQATMSSSTLVQPAGDLARRAASAAPVPPPLDVAQAELDGVRWTYRPAAAALLSRYAARYWATPAEHGWECVKRNARREVWRATIDGQRYYAKYYFCHPWRDAVRRVFQASACEREWEGGLYALRAGIAAVRPLACARGLRCGGRRCDLLLTEAVEPVYSLSDFWQSVQRDDDRRRRGRDGARLCERLAELIARAHQAGFEHLDLHAANILVQPVAPGRYRTLFVDLQSARRGVPVRARAVVRNLAQLNQWFHKHSTIGDRLRFLRAYLRWRNEFEDALPYGRALGLGFEELVAALAGAARRHAQRLGTQRDHRALRDGRYFARVRLPGGWRGVVVTRCKHPADDSHASHLVFEPAWWQAQLRNMEAWFEGAGAETCKDSHSASVRRAVLVHGSDRVPVIVKRPRARNWRRRIVQLVMSSRSQRGWRVGHALLHRDVPTARPLAVLERRVGPLVLDSVLVTEALPGGVDLETYLRRAYATCTPTEWYRLKRELTGLLVQHVRRLQERGFRHRDCKASNVLVGPPPQLKLLWIDLDGVRYSGVLAPRRQLRPLVRLHVSLLDVPGLTRTDRVRFVRAYFTRFGSAPESWRAVWPGMARAAAEKLRALAARRAWKRAHYGRE